METRSQAQEMERRAQEMERRMNDGFRELSQRQEMLQKQALEQRQEARTDTARTDARLEEMMQAILAISLQNQAGIGSARPPPAGIGVGEESNARNEWGKATRFEFPKFEGEGFDGWIMRVDYFFEVAGTPAKERVRIAALHLEGKAIQWHRGYLSLQGNKAYDDWEGYIKSMAARFGAHAYEDPLSDLRNLRQVSSLQLYMDTFDELYPRAEVREDQALSFFLSGLIDELQMPVRMFKPKCLADAYALAKLQELTVKAMHNKPRVTSSTQYASIYSSNTKPLTVTTSNYKPNVPAVITKEPLRNNAVARPGPRLTSKEVEERRSKGLCFWCDEKYTPNHHCPKKRAFVIHMLDEEAEIEGEEEQVEGEENETATELLLSLHAMWGIEGAQIMRVRRNCQKKTLRILMNTNKYQIC